MNHDLRPNVALQLTIAAADGAGLTAALLLDALAAELER